MLVASYHHKYVINVVNNSSKPHLLGCPLESSDDIILDFVKVLYGLGAINEDVRSVGVWTETPDLSGLVDIVFVLLGEVTSTGLDVLTWGD